MIISKFKCQLSKYCGIEFETCSLTIFLQYLDKHPENPNRYPFFIYLYKHIQKMTELGEFFNKKSVNKAEISRRTGISPSRLSELSLKEKARLTVEEIYLIALAMDVEPAIILTKVCENVELVTEK